MALQIARELLPLEVDPDGVVRVGGTRVTLDTVIAAFNEEATPEEIAQQYPSLSLADIYAVLGYYLRHRPEVEAYLRHREQQAQRDPATSRSPLSSPGSPRAPAGPPQVFYMNDAQARSRYAYERIVKVVIHA